MCTNRQKPVWCCEIRSSCTNTCRAKDGAYVCQKVCVEFLQNKNENEVQPGKVSTTQVCDNSAQLFQVFEMRCDLWRIGEEFSGNQSGFAWSPTFLLTIANIKQQWQCLLQVLWFWLNGFNKNTLWRSVTYSPINADEQISQRIPVVYQR